jgi:hypothetical protein
MNRHALKRKIRARHVLCHHKTIDGQVNNKKAIDGWAYSLECIRMAHVMGFLSKKGTAPAPDFSFQPMLQGRSAKNVVLLRHMK